MNSSLENSAKSITEYMDNLAPDRKDSIKSLDELIKKSAPNLEPFFAHNMLSYGAFKYRNSKKEVIEWPIIAVANQKNYISVYVCALDGEDYLAEKYKDDLGKASVGKSCIRFKNLDQVDLGTLKKIIKLATKNPGIPGTEPVS